MLIRVSVSKEKLFPSSRSNDPIWVLLFTAVEGSNVLRNVDRSQRHRILEMI